MTQTQSSLLTVVIGASVLALIFAVFLARWVLARGRGTPEMQKISDAIQQGAEAYLARQYKTIGMLSSARAPRRVGRWTTAARP